MSLVHKSIDVRPELWRKVRINAEVSGVAVRDFIAFLIQNSSPVEDNDPVRRGQLIDAVEANRRASSQEQAVGSQQKQ